MGESPEGGKIYWLITDVYGDTCAIPVTIRSEKDSVYTVRWEITAEYSEDYEGIEEHQLYESEAGAREAIEQSQGGVDVNREFEGRG